MKKREKKSPVPALCSALGTVLLILLVLACVPLTVPRVFGYEIYTVISGSMDPAIPTGSLVYIADTDPGEIVEGDVIAFYGGMSGNSGNRADGAGSGASSTGNGAGRGAGAAESGAGTGGSGASIITHRVVSNSVIMGEFITRGDANEKEDINPVSYDNYIGKVQLSVPMAGYAAELFTSTQGKIAAVCVIAVAALLQVPAWRGRR